MESIHVIGGGSQNPMLCQMTADSTGRSVVAGPVEATTLGNAIVQLIALDKLDDVAHARKVLSQTLDTISYLPREPKVWREPYTRFKSLCSETGP